MLRALETLQPCKNTGQNGGVSTKRKWQNWARLVLGVQSRMLPRLILIVATVLTCDVAKAGQPPTGCSQPGTVLLSAPRLKSLLLKTEPIQVPGVDGRHICGILVFSVAIDTSGEVTYIEFVSGHLAIVQTAIESIRLWKFRPYFAAGKKKHFYRRITVKYQTIGSGVTYRVI